MKQKIWVYLVIVAVVAVAFSMLFAFQVRSTEAVVVTRNEKIVATLGPEQAGFHWKLPWPIDRVDRYDARLQTFETEFRQVSTEDQKTIILTAFATWRVKEPDKFLQTIGRSDNDGGGIIRNLLENSVTNTLKRHHLSDLINPDPQKIKFAEMEAEFLAAIQDQALSNYGILINSVGIKRLGLPEEVTRDVFERMKKDREKTSKTLEAEGEAEAKKIRVDAEAKQKKILARAEAYAKKIEALGDAEAAKYYKVFEQHYELSSFLKTMESFLRQMRLGETTLIIDAGKFPPFQALRDPEAAPGQPAADKPAKADGGNE